MRLKFERQLAERFAKSIRKELAVDWLDADTHALAHFMASIEGRKFTAGLVNAHLSHARLSVSAEDPALQSFHQGTARGLARTIALFESLAGADVSAEELPKTPADVVNDVFEQRPLTTNNTLLTHA